MPRIVKVIELLADSDTSWEDAARSAVKEAQRTIRGITHAQVENLQAVVSEQRIVQFRLALKLSFEVDS